jgi:hypothetical protein
MAGARGGAGVFADAEHEGAGSQGDEESDDGDMEVAVRGQRHAHHARSVVQAGGHDVGQDDPGGVHDLAGEPECEDDRTQRKHEQVRHGITASM